MTTPNGDGGPPVTPTPTPRPPALASGRTGFPFEVAARLDGWSVHTTPTAELLRGPHGVDLAMTPLTRRPGWRVHPVFSQPALGRVAARPALPPAIHVEDRDPARAASRIARRLLPHAELAVYVRRLDLLLDAVTQAAARSRRAHETDGPTQRAGGEGYAAAWPYLEYVLDHLAPVLDRIRLLGPEAAMRDPRLWMAFPALHDMRDLLMAGRALRHRFEAVDTALLPDHPRTPEVRERARLRRAQDAVPLLDRLHADAEDFARLARAVAIPSEHTHCGLHTPHTLGWEWLLAQGPQAPFSDHHVADLLSRRAPLTVLATAPTPPGWDGGLPGTAIVARTETGEHLALHVRPDHSGETALWHATNRTLDSAARVLHQRFDADHHLLADQARDAGARLARPGLTPLPARRAPRLVITATPPITRSGRRR
ncbi:hypothetical protein [Streptacidiphilus fuscans]|uniref:Uncharacterized protein n=1 Tax=Streptacidiphilus fuscans TaxID=2789292 RepID=A0A931FIH5_9ACTN|nr:hypothetical protein [Streptacidiphilus fuscans]MBF9071794.1 hypothetical protein [Streptacidiphilus fuscans]